MMGSKFMKAFVLGVGITALSSTAAFASTGGIEPAMVRDIQPAAANALYEKQAEIDRYVFEEHAKELEARGISITHTGVVGDAVEIGILPYSEDHAKYLYEAFGSDAVKVVEGMQAVIMTMTAGPDTPVALAAPDENTEVLQYTEDPNAMMYATSVADDTGSGVTVRDAQIYETTTVQDAELYKTTTVQDAELYTTTSDPTVQLVSATGVKETSAAANVLFPIAGAAAAVVLLGGTVMVLRRQKAGSR